MPKDMSELANKLVTTDSNDVETTSKKKNTKNSLRVLNVKITNEQLVKLTKHAKSNYMPATNVIRKFIDSLE